MAPSWLLKPSAATVRVKKATNRLLLDPDWTMNMEICDSINSEPLQAKDILKAVKMRLHNKTPRVQFLALTLLETMIKNCGDFLHFHVIDREILKDMVKIARKTTDLPVRVKILVLLDTWQETFGGPGGKNPQYYFAYAELKTSGIKMHQKDVTLMYTPDTQPCHPQLGNAMPSSSAERPEVVTSERAELSLSDLNNARIVVKLFIDMLHELIQEGHWALEDEVIADLDRQCRTNQNTLIRLINSTQNEELLREALALSDNLQYALGTHDAIAYCTPLSLEAAYHKHDATAYESPLPLEAAYGKHCAFSRPWALPPPTPSRRQQFMDREVEDFTVFNYLAHSDYNFKSTGDQLALPKKCYYSTATSNLGFSEISLSHASNALVQLHPPTPVNIPKKEEDIINQDSLAVSPDPSCKSSPVPSPTSNKNQNSSASPAWQQQSSNPEPLRPNQGCAASESDIAPWSIPADAKLLVLPPSTMSQQQVTHPCPSWSYTSGINSHPLLSTTSFQHPAFQSAIASAPAIPVDSSLQYPPSQSTTSPDPVAPEPFPDTKAMYNSFSSTEMQVNANNLKQTVASTIQEPCHA